MPAAEEALEHIQGVQSLDVHVLIAQLVGAVQAQAAQIASQSNQIKKQSRQVEQQAVYIEKLSQRITHLESHVRVPVAAPT